MLGLLVLPCGPRKSGGRYIHSYQHESKEYSPDVVCCVMCVRGLHIVVRMLGCIAVPPCDGCTVRLPTFILIPMNDRLYEKGVEIEGNLTFRAMLVASTTELIVLVGQETAVVDVALMSHGAGIGSKSGGSCSELLADVSAIDTA